MADTDDDYEILGSESTMNYRKWRDSVLNYEGDEPQWQHSSLHRLHGTTVDLDLSELDEDISDLDSNSSSVSLNMQSNGATTTTVPDPEPEPVTTNLHSESEPLPMKPKSRPVSKQAKAAEELASKSKKSSSAFKAVFVVDPPPNILSRFKDIDVAVVESRKGTLAIHGEIDPEIKPSEVLWAMFVSGHPRKYQNSILEQFGYHFLDSPRLVLDDEVSWIEDLKMSSTQEFLKANNKFVPSEDKVRNVLEGYLLYVCVIGLIFAALKAAGTNFDSLFETAYEEVRKVFPQVETARDFVHHALNPVSIPEPTPMPELIVPAHNLTNTEVSTVAISTRDAIAELVFRAYLSVWKKITETSQTIEELMTSSYLKLVKDITQWRTKFTDAN